MCFTFTSVFTLNEVITTCNVCIQVDNYILYYLVVWKVAEVCDELFHIAVIFLAPKDFILSKSNKSFASKDQEKFNFSTRLRCNVVWNIVIVCVCVCVCVQVHPLPSCRRSTRTASRWFSVWSGKRPCGTSLCRRRLGLCGWDSRSTGRCGTLWANGERTEGLSAGADASDLMLLFVCLFVSSDQVRDAGGVLSQWQSRGELEIIDLSSFPIHLSLRSAL